MNNTYDDKEVLLLVANGDQNAFSFLFRKYMPIVYRHLLLYVKSVPSAQELAQDIFMIIWKNRNKLAGMENFPGYIYVITRNKALKAVQDILENSENPPDDMIQVLLQEPDSKAEVKDLQRVLYEGIESMPPRRKEVFKLSRIEQLSYKEIASQLQISTNAVKLHIVEALLYLRTFIKEKADIVILLLLSLLVQYL